VFHLLYLIYTASKSTKLRQIQFFFIRYSSTKNVTKIRFFFLVRLQCTVKSEAWLTIRFPFILSQTLRYVALKHFLHELSESKFHSFACSCPRFNGCDAHVKALRLISVTHWQESCDSLVSNKYISLCFIQSNNRERYVSSSSCYNNKKNNNNNFTHHTKYP
jgi:hypothetical protein